MQLKRFSPQARPKHMTIIVNVTKINFNVISVNIQNIYFTVSKYRSMLIVSQTYFLITFQTQLNKLQCRQETRILQLQIVHSCSELFSLS